MKRTIINLPKYFKVRMIKSSTVPRDTVTVLVNKKDADTFFKSGLNVEYDSPCLQHKFLFKTTNPKSH